MRNNSQFDYIYFSEMRHLQRRVRLQMCSLKLVIATLSKMFLSSHWSDKLLVPPQTHTFVEPEVVKWGLSNKQSSASIGK